MQQNENDSRHQIWIALSEFYLDTVLDHKRFDHIADIFIKSTYSINEIKKIDRYEVFPTLHLNLLSVAGEWSWFEEDWLFDVCRKNMNKRKHWFFRKRYEFLDLLLFWMRSDCWKEIDKRVN